MRFGLADKLAVSATLGHADDADDAGAFHVIASESLPRSQTVYILRTFSSCWRRHRRLSAARAEKFTVVAIPAYQNDEK